LQVCFKLDASLRQVDASLQQVGSKFNFGLNPHYTEANHRAALVFPFGYTGIVEHIGRKKYVLARSLYAATGKTGVHTRHVDLIAFF